MDLIAARCRIGPDEMTTRYGESAGRVEQRPVECVAKASAKRSDVVELFGENAAWCRPSPYFGIRWISVGERNVGFTPNQNARRKYVVVSELETAKETA
jgi:hypothetical protein